MRVYTVKGTTTDVLTCEQCGRDDLKKTVVLDALDAEGNPTGDITYMGTDCAARAAGWTQSEVTRRARKADERAKVEARNARLAETAQSAKQDEAAKIEWLEGLVGRKMRKGEHWGDLARDAGFDRPFLAYKAWEQHKKEG